MKNVVIIAMILVFLVSCASLPGVRGDNFANNAPTENVVVKKAESDHWWYFTMMILGTGLGVLGNAILLNNFW